MKMIDVLNLMEQGEIKGSTRLSFYIKSERYDYVYDETIETFADVDCLTLDEEHMLSKSFLGLEVKLIPPKPKKYQLKLFKNDVVSYVTRSPYENFFGYYVSDKNETCNFITKFTQEEIDNDKLLKFVEEHGIKEEVEE